MPPRPTCGWSKTWDKADATRRWGFVFAIARTWKTVEEKSLKTS